MSARWTALATTPGRYVSAEGVRGIARGLDVDTFAPRLSFFWDIHNDFFEEIAKLRAARRIWATVMRDRFGAKKAESMRLRTHTQVLDDQTAYLVSPDPEALGNGLADLLSNPTLREQLARQAKAYVQREFTPEAAHRKLGSFYSMMESKASRAGA